MEPDEPVDRPDDLSIGSCQGSTRAAAGSCWDRSGLLMTYRDHELVASPHLERFLGDFAADAFAARLSLRRLSAQAVGELAAMGDRCCRADAADPRQSAP